MSNVYRVEVGGATYWMKLDEPKHDDIMAALFTVDDSSPTSDIAEIVAMNDLDLDRLHFDEDGDPYTVRAIATERTAPCVLGCSEWA